MHVLVTGGWRLRNTSVTTESCIVVLDDTEQDVLSRNSASISPVKLSLLSSSIRRVLLAGWPAAGIDAKDFPRTPGTKPALQKLDRCLNFSLHPSDASSGPTPWPDHSSCFSRSHCICCSRPKDPTAPDKTLFCTTRVMPRARRAGSVSRRRSVATTQDSSLLRYRTCRSAASRSLQQLSFSSSEWLASGRHA